MKHSRFFIFIVLVFLQLFLSLNVANAQQSRNWIPAASGSYFSPQNWSPFGVPGPADAVFFTNGANNQVTWDRNFSSGQFTVGPNNNLALVSQPGARFRHTALGQFLVSGEAQIGGNPGGTSFDFTANAGTFIDGGRIEITNGGTLTSNAILSIDNGELNQNIQSTLTVNGNLTATDSLIDLESGTTSVTGTFSLIDSFDSGVSVLNIRNQTTTDIANFDIGSSDSAVNIRQSGRLSANRLTLAGTLIIFGPNATLDVDELSFLSSASSVRLFDGATWETENVIAGSAFTVGNVRVDRDSTWTNVGDTPSLNSVQVTTRAVWNQTGAVNARSVLVSNGSAWNQNGDVSLGDLDLYGDATVNLNGFDLEIFDRLSADFFGDATIINNANSIVAGSISAFDVTLDIQANSLETNRISYFAAAGLLDIANGIVANDIEFTSPSAFREGYDLNAGFIEQGDNANLNFTGDLNAGFIEQGFNSSIALTGNIDVGFISQNSGSTFQFNSGILTLTDDERAFYSIGAGEVFDSTRQLHNAGRTIVEQATNLELSEGGVLSAGRLTNLGTINVSTDYTLGDSSRFDAFQGDGLLTVDNATLTINDANVAELGRITALRNNATIAASNGFLVGDGFVLEGQGTVDGTVAAGTGSLILANGGSLTLGDSTRFNGFVSQGELRTGTNTVTLLDANQAVLGSITELGAAGVEGQLVADNGLVIETGNNLIGFGTIDSINAIEAAVINNGFVSGNSEDELLTFTGYVRGIGTFDNVVFDGTFDPGQSPAELQVGNLFFSEDNLLILELGGLERGDEFDALISDGSLSFDGELQISLINGFNPNLDDSFDLFDFVSSSGQFSILTLPTLQSGLTFDTSQLYSSGVISVVAVPEPGAIFLVPLFGCLVFSRRRREKKQATNNDVAV